MNTDRHLDGTEAPAARLTGDLEDALARLSERLSRVEVHLRDVNGSNVVGAAIAPRCRRA